jgi:hypothetical protein
MLVFACMAENVVVVSVLYWRCAMSDLLQRNGNVFVGFLKYYSNRKNKKTRRIAAGPWSLRLRFSSRLTAACFFMVFCASFIVHSVGVAALSLWGNTRHEPKPLSVAQNVPDSMNTTGTGVSPNGPSPSLSPQKRARAEVVSKRTEDTKTYDNGDGTSEIHNYQSRVHYKDSGNWRQIDTTVVTDVNAADSTNALGEAISWVKNKTQDLQTYKVKANDWQARFAASDDAVGMVRIEADGQKLRLTPVGAASGITPTIKNMEDGTQTITYTQNPQLSEKTTANQ